MPASDQNPGVTVVVCCYNAERTVGQALTSLQAQTWSPIEILVVDDGSKDGSLPCVEGIAARDSRLRILPNRLNCGTAATRQRGLCEATYDLIMFLDADDVAEPDLVAKLAQVLLSDPEIIGVGCHARYVDEHGKPLGLQRLGPKSRSDFERLYSSDKLIFMLPTTLFRRSDAQAVGGYRLNLMPNEDGVRYEDFAEDLDLWCRMSDFGGQGRYFITIPEPLFKYRKPGASLSTRNLTIMQLKMRWIRDCLRRRRAGDAERTLDQFLSSRTPLERFHDRRSDIAAAFYKKAAFGYSGENWVSFALNILCAALLSPKLIRQKLKTQMASR